MLKAVLLGRPLVQAGGMSRSSKFEKVLPHPSPIMRSRSIDRINPPDRLVDRGHELVVVAEGVEDAAEEARGLTRRIEEKTAVVPDGVRRRRPIVRRPLGRRAGRAWLERQPVAALERDRCLV